MHDAALLSVVGFDADDTLWQNEKYFRLSEDSFAGLLAEYSTRSDLRAHFLQTERRNLNFYGFGIKGFTLSMIETAVEITDGRVPVPVIRQIIELGREMLKHPVELLPGARETVETLSREMKVILVTKGDLLDQERKLAQSGLGEMFHGVEIVSDKTPELYRRIFHEYGDGPHSAMMVGNSVRSDIVPALEAGGWGVHVPHGLEWEFERQAPPHRHPRFRQLSDLCDVVPFVQDIRAGKFRGSRI